MSELDDLENQRIDGIKLQNVPSFAKKQSLREKAEYLSRQLPLTSYDKDLRIVAISCIEQALQEARDEGLEEAANVVSCWEPQSRRGDSCECPGHILQRKIRALKGKQ